MYRCDHGLWDARRRADRVLEGAEVGTRLERAAGCVGVLREREQLRHWRNGGVIGDAVIVRLFLGRERSVKLVGAQGGDGEGYFGDVRTVYAR